MKFEIGDIVQTKLYGASILYKIVCFFDRGNERACHKHQDVELNPALPDDVHVEVIWKKHKAIGPSWPVGEPVTFSHAYLQTPTSNEMLVLALAAS